MIRELRTEPLPGHIVHIAQQDPFTILLKAYVRAAWELPTQKQLEDVAAQRLLSLPHLDEGADWDVSSVIIPDQESLKSLLELAIQVKGRMDDVFAVVAGDTEEFVRKAQDALFVLIESMKEVLGLEEA